MQGYSNQKYNLINNKYDSKNKVSLIDMEVISDTGNILVTWRLKKSKDRFYVIDLIVADISLVVTKRSEFNSLFKTVDYKLKDFNEILKNQNELSYEKLLNLPFLAKSSYFIYYHKKIENSTTSFCFFCCGELFVALSQLFFFS